MGSFGHLVIWSFLQVLVELIGGDDVLKMEEAISGEGVGERRREEVHLPTGEDQEW